MRPFTKWIRCNKALLGWLGPTTSQLLFPWLRSLEATGQVWVGGETLRRGKNFFGIQKLQWDQVGLWFNDFNSRHTRVSRTNKKAARTYWSWQTWRAKPILVVGWNKRCLVPLLTTRFPIWDQRSMRNGRNRTALGEMLKARTKTSTWNAHVNKYVGRHAFVSFWGI